MTDDSSQQARDAESDAKILGSKVGSTIDSLNMEATQEELKTEHYVQCRVVIHECSWADLKHLIAHKETPIDFMSSPEHIITFACATLFENNWCNADLVWVAEVLKDGEWIPVAT